MLRCRLLTGLVLVALLAGTSAIDASLCNANCALAGPGRFHDHHLHHPQSSPLTTTAAQHHHHDGLSSLGCESSSLVALSPQCRFYSQFLALNSASKLSLTRSVFSADRVALDGTFVCAPELSPQG